MNIGTVRALERLENDDTSHLTRDEFIELVKAATGNTRLAHTMARKRMAAQLDLGVRPT